MEGAYPLVAEIETATELLRLVNFFEQHVVYSDLYSEVKFGCDCGCGGDSYTVEEWVAMCDEHDKHLAQFQRFCKSIGLRWDFAHLAETNVVVIDGE